MKQQLGKLGKIIKTTIITTQKLFLLGTLKTRTKKLVKKTH